jgi:hypothetical protein
LSTASSAEIGVSLKANQSADPTYYGGPSGRSQTPDTSRVSSHDIATRVRVDSIKLFEVSSFSAELQRARSRFPLLPPFVELPYIGTLIGIPLPVAKEYHMSTAILSAMVVPTAADLAYGLRFTGDRILDATEPGECAWIDPESRHWAKPDGRVSPQACRTRRALSLRDHGDRPISGFHKVKILCLAGETGAKNDERCRNLTFAGILHDSRN